MSDRARDYARAVAGALARTDPGGPQAEPTAAEARWQALRSDLQELKNLYQDAVDKPHSDRKQAIAAGYVDCCTLVLAAMDRAEKEGK